MPPPPSKRARRSPSVASSASSSSYDSLADEPVPTVTLKSKGKASAKLHRDDSPLDITTDAWVWAKPTERDPALRKIDGKAAKWSVYSETAEDHTARWRVIRAATAAGRMGYMAGATTGAPKGTSYTKHLITVYVGNGDDADAHAAVLRVLRRDAGVKDRVWCTDEQTRARWWEAAEGATTIVRASGAPPPPAAPAASRGSATIATAPAASRGSATIAATCSEFADGINWDDPAVLAELETVDLTVRKLAAAASPPPKSLPVTKLKPGQQLVVVVAGTKEWNNDAAAERALRTVANDYGVIRNVLLVHGDNQGADRTAARVARKMGYEVVAELANWNAEGSAAGPRRNARMFDAHRPHLLVVLADALTDARGALSCISEAKRHGVAVRTFSSRGEVHDGSSAHKTPSPPSSHKFSAHSRAAVHEADDDAVLAACGMTTTDAKPATHTKPARGGAGAPREADDDEVLAAFSAPKATLTTMALPKAVAVSGLPREADDDEVLAACGTGGAVAHAIAPAAEPPRQWKSSSSVVLKGLTDPDTVCVSNPPHHMDFVRPPLPPKQTPATNETADVGDDVGDDKHEDTDDEGGDAGAAELDLLGFEQLAALEEAHVLPTRASPPTRAELALRLPIRKPPALRLTVGEFFKLRVMVTREQAEALRRAKQGSDTWLDGRMFCLTASVYGAAAGMSPYQPPRGNGGLVQDKLWNLFSGNEATRWGNAHEPHARESFLAWFKTTLLRERYASAGKSAEAYAAAAAKVRLLEFGLIVFPQTPWMGASPDGVVLYLDVDDTLKMDLVEFKCPFYLWNTPDHPYAKSDKNTPPYYNAQIQGIMGYLNAHTDDWRAIVTTDLADDAALQPHLATARWTFTQCWFVVWQPRQLWITRRDFDAAMYAERLFPALKAWYFDAFLPAATHKENGLLAFGEEEPCGATLVAPDWTDAELAAVVAATEAAATHSHTTWPLDAIVARLTALADGGVAARHAFKSERDTKGKHKLECLRRSLPLALKGADAEATASVIDALARMVGPAHTREWVSNDPLRALDAAFDADATH